MFRFLRVTMLWVLLATGAGCAGQKVQRPPTHIIADDVQWSIKVVPCYQLPDLLFWQASDAWCPILGYTEPESHTVYILRGQKLSDEQETLLHELMHVVVGVDHSNDQTTIHGAIYTISEALAPTLTQNPQLLTYFGMQ